MKHRIAFYVIPVEPRQGQARFRIKDQPLGVNWENLPYRSEYEVFLSAGSAMWLRLMVKNKIEQTWSLIELHNHALKNNVCLQPFLWTNLRYLRAEDGFGTYSVNNLGDTEWTDSVAFAFETGEVWIIDTFILGADTQGLPFLTIAPEFVRTLERCGVFLRSLGIAPPFHWIAGIEGVKGRILRLPQVNILSEFSSGGICLSDTIKAEGTYDTQQSPGKALQSFFNQLFHKCGSQYPTNLRLAIEGEKRR